jgi:hypothetical protein
MGFLSEIIADAFQRSPAQPWAEPLLSEQGLPDAEGGVLPGEGSLSMPSSAEFGWRGESISGNRSTGSKETAQVSVEEQLVDVPRGGARSSLDRQESRRRATTHGVSVPLEVKVDQALAPIAAMEHGVGESARISAPPSMEREGWGGASLSGNQRTDSKETAQAGLEEQRVDVPRGDVRNSLQLGVSSTQASFPVLSTEHGSEGGGRVPALPLVRTAPFEKEHLTSLPIRESGIPQALSNPTSPTVARTARAFAHSPVNAFASVPPASTRPAPGFTTIGVTAGEGGHIGSGGGEGGTGKAARPPESRTQGEVLSRGPAAGQGPAGTFASRQASELERAERGTATRTVEESPSALRSAAAESSAPMLPPRHNASEPRVHIGQVHVLITAPAREPRPTAPSPASNLLNRHYLRST